MKVMPGKTPEQDPTSVSGNHTVISNDVRESISDCRNSIRGTSGAQPAFIEMHRGVQTIF